MRHPFNSLRAVGLGFALAGILTAASPAAAANTPEEQANKKVVLDFYAALNAADATHSMKERIQGIAETYLSPDYAQHSEAFLRLPGPGTARDKLIRMFQNTPPAPPGALVMPKTLAIMAEGDLVMMLTSRDKPDPATGEVKGSFIFNMFRVKDGKLVEHWDVAPNAGGPPPGVGAPPPGAGGPR